MKTTRWTAYAMVAIGALIMVAPFYFMFVFATHTSAEIYSLPPPRWFGTALLNNIELLQERLPFWRNIGISLYVALMTTALTLFFCSLGGYAFAMYEFRFKRPLFTLGREPLEHLHEIPEGQFWTLRALDTYPGNTRCEVIGARGPFVIDDERALFAQRRIDVLISKNSGSSATEPKLEVARERGTPVLILKRPKLPEVDRAFLTSDEVLEALKRESYL